MSAVAGLLLMIAGADGPAGPELVVAVNGAAPGECVIGVAGDGDYRLSTPEDRARFVERYPPKITSVRPAPARNITYQCLGGTVFVLLSEGYRVLDAITPSVPDEGGNRR